VENKDILELVFIRHAETQYDLIEDRDNCDGNLTPRGEEQCREAGYDDQQDLADFLHRIVHFGCLLLWQPFLVIHL